MDWGAGRLALLCLLLGVWAPAVRGKIAADQHWGAVATCLLNVSTKLCSIVNFFLTRVSLIIANLRLYVPNA